MDSHQNARTTPHSRPEIVRRLTEERQPVRVVAQAFGISERTVRKWAARAYHAGGLRDRSCRPHRSPRGRPPPSWRRSSPCGGPGGPAPGSRRRWALSRATVGRILRRLDLARLRALVPAAPVRRYERARPGELLHVDIKKLGRIAGIGDRITGDWRHRARGDRLGVPARRDR